MGIILTITIECMFIFLHSLLLLIYFTMLSIVYTSSECLQMLYEREMDQVEEIYDKIRAHIMNKRA